MRHFKTATILSFLIAVLCVQLSAAELSNEQFWLVDTRPASMSCDCDATFDKLDFSYRDNCQWHSSTIEEFFASSDPNVPTGIFVHGNLTDRCKAISDGHYVYNYMKQRAEGRPFRFIVWTWPAQKVRGGLRHDARTKAHRCDAQGLFLAHFFNRAGQKTPVCAIGHSFGARIIASALHMMGGGQIAGQSLNGSVRKRKTPLRAVLVAAAMDSNALLPNHRNGSTIDGVDRLLITRNRCDRVLKWYPLMTQRGNKQQALGYVGPTCVGCLGQEREKIDIVSTTCSVGKTHKWPAYICSGTLRNRIATYFFPEHEEEK